jgi:neutral ceramidase
MSQLVAGAAQVDITPGLGAHLCGYFSDRRATDILDPLHAKTIALSDGETTLGLVICDLIVVPGKVVDAAKALVTERTGIAPEKVLIAGTHTHTGPAIVGALGTPEEEGYGDWVAPRIADAFSLALEHMQPARVAHAAGACPGEVHNRRWHMKDGTVRMNPGHQNPDAVRPAGPTDPQLGLMILHSAEGAPIAALGNLSLHYVGVSGNHNVICADYFAAFGRALNRYAGAAFICPLSNGTFGDVNNIDATDPARQSHHPTQQIERVANVVAGEAWRVWNGLREDDFRDDVPLGAKITRVNFPARCPSEDELAAARALYESGENWQDSEWIYARELVLLAEEPAEWTVPIHTMRIGDLGIVGLPGEVFTEIGLDIKARSPFPQTMNVGVANDTVGYVATGRALDEGSYETRLCRHVRAPKGTGKLWADTAVAGLESLRQ